MEIRSVEQAAVLPLLNQVFEEQQQKEFADKFLEESAQTFSFGAWVDGELAGGIVGKQQYDTLHISLLGVVANFQKYGIGSKLMQSMEEQARQSGIKTITLTTKAYQALGFYLKHGYEVFGELKDVPMVGTTKCYLVKRIK